MLGHQGGWDELLLPLAAVVAVLGVARLFGRRRRDEGADPSAPADPSACAYCGGPLEPDAERCGACGFRVAR